MTTRCIAIQFAVLLVSSFVPARTARARPDALARPRPTGAPDFVSEDKRLSAEDVDSKAEGYYLTGLPEAEVNPINGIGLGGNVFLFNNGQRTDPLFEYQPYRQRYAGTFKVFQNGKWQGTFNTDHPYLFDSPWRLRADLVLENDPNYQYFGVGSETMQALRGFDRRSGQVRTFSRMQRYLDNNAIVRMGNPGLGEAEFVTDRHYNELDYTETLLNLLGERTFLGGKLRLMFGYELLLIGIRDYTNRPAEEAFDPSGRPRPGVTLNGRTRLFEDAFGVTPGNPWQRLNVRGYRGGRESIAAFAFIYDTRDFEPDPTRGVFLEYSHEHSHPYLGSQFSFDKMLLQTTVWRDLLRRPRRVLRRLVLAVNADLGYVWGRRIPFYEMFDLSSQSEAGGTEVLGGDRSLRGYREYRFVAPVTALVNVELRARLVEGRLLRQHFSFAVVPFVDAGRVWDRLRDLGLRDWRYNVGSGLRLAWNQATILRLDFAWSAESYQSFFGFSHIF